MIRQSSRTRTVHIMSLSDESKCISVDGNSAEDGLNVCLQTYTGANNQLWKLVQNGSYYGIVSPEGVFYVMMHLGQKISLMGQIFIYILFKKY